MVFNSRRILSLFVGKDQSSLGPFRSSEKKLYRLEFFFHRVEFNNALRRDMREDLCAQRLSSRKVFNWVPQSATVQKQTAASNTFTLDVIDRISPIILSENNVDMLLAIDARKCIMW